MIYRENKGKNHMDKVAPVLNKEAGKSSYRLLIQYTWVENVA